MSVANPLVNGNRFSFSSIEAAVLGVIFYGFGEVNYSDNLDPGDVRGTSSQRLGRTQGDYKAEASIGVYLEEWLDLQVLLAPAPPLGLMTTVFNVVVNYAELALNPPQTDVIKGCRIKKIANDFKQSTEGLLVKLDLDVSYIIRNGRVPFPTLIAG